MIFTQEQLERMNAAAAKHRAERAERLEREPSAFALKVARWRAEDAEQSSGQLVPMDQQLDAAGELHDIAPATSRERLFEPAPEQIPGQLGLELGGDS